MTARSTLATASLLGSILASVLGCVLGWANASAAQAPLRVRTLEDGEWSASVARLQADPTGEGRVLHVVVEDDRGHRAPCGGYQLMLDPDGTAAFDTVGCDPATASTALRLVDRRALFALGDVVSRPRQIGIAAIEQRTGSALGGATVSAQSELRCSIAVRPYLHDMLTGERVLATPERFLMRPIGDGAEVEADGDGWRVRAGSVRVSYELVDRQNGDVVLQETVRLSCGNDDPPAPEVGTQAGTVSGRDVIPLVTHRVFRGATMTRSRFDDHGSCGGHEGPEQWYVVRLDAPARLGLRLVSEFDATIYVREGSPIGPEIACQDRAARLETVDINLGAGVYYVAVDGTGSYGRYRLMSFEEEADPRALDDTPRPIEREAIAELLPAVSRHEASCGGREAPEHVYTLRVERPSFVSVRLTSRFDSALYVVDAGGIEVGCRATLGWPREPRRSHVRAELPAGLYYVVVDGESAYAGTGLYQLAVDRLPLR